MDDSKVSSVPLLRTNAGPADSARWTQRLKEEYRALISFVQRAKEDGTSWCVLEGNRDGTLWEGECSATHHHVKYTFRLVVTIPVAYPTAAPEMALPQLDGRTVKMYRGGNICTTAHFEPLWRRHAPTLGIAHALVLGLGPWLSVEIPAMVEEGFIRPGEFS